MAIVFISPKKKQRLIFWAFSLGLVLVLMLISAVSLLPEIKNELTIVPEQSSVAAPDVSIDFTIIDSQKIKDLESFDGVAMDFSYQAKDAAGKSVSGQISAASLDLARQTLEKQGLLVSSIQPVQAGRSDPFNAYYQTPVKPPLK